MKQGFRKRVLPHVAALAVFAGVAALFFAPQFEGRALRQGDMVRASGMGQDIKEHVATYGEHPQWAGRMFGGMPAYMIDMNYDGRLAKEAGDTLYFLGEPAGWIFVAMAGFYLMLVLMGVDPWLGIIGGVGYGLSSYFIIIIGAGHVTKMLALAWVAPMVGAVWYAYRRRMWLGAMSAGLFAAIVVATSHLQIPYYFLFVLLALVVSEFVRAYRERALARFVRVSAALLGAGVLAVGANFVQLYYVASHADDTIRGKSELTELQDRETQTSGLDKDYATEWSYGKLETLNLLVPNLYGGGSDFAVDGAVAQSLRPYSVPRGFAQSLPSYWGPQRFTEGPVYIGAALILLAVLGLFLLPGREKWWIVGVSILAIFLAWGRYMMWFTDLFLDYFPLYNKFRTVSMILVVVEWSVPLLAVLGLQRIWDGSKGTGVDSAKVLQGLKWSVIVVGGLCLVIGLLGPAMSSFSKESDLSYGLPEQIVSAMQAERASLMRADAFRSLAFVLLAAGLVWIWVKGWLGRGWFVVAMAGVVVVDLFAVDKRYVSAGDFVAKRVGKGELLAPPMTQADRQILRDTTDYRVANFADGNPFVDGTNATAYYHRSVGGYHAAKLRRYDELITHHLARMNTAVYDMLNVKYFVVPGAENGPPRVELNPEACGSAWYVRRLEPVAGADAELAALGGAEFDPHRVAVVDTTRFTELPQDVGSDTLSQITLTEYRTNRLTYRTRSQSDGVAVFSEIYYPKGWTAYIDGEPAPYFRVNYVLRAMAVPAGEHQIVFAFAAPHFGALVWITRICSLILLLGTLGLLVQTLLRTWPKREE